jgi:tight adherence protein B
MIDILIFDRRTLGLVIAAFIVFLVVAIYVSHLLASSKRDRMTKIILDKTTGAGVKARSVILDVEARAMKNTGRDQKFAFELINWFAIKRDLKRSGLPAYPPVLFLAAAVASYAVAFFIIAAPTEFMPSWQMALIVYPGIYFLFRTGIIGIFKESRRMKMMTQLVIFIESVQRAVSVGTAPDEAVAEGIKECEMPLKDSLAAIKELLDLGYDFIDAINLAADRVNLPEFDIFVASLTAQSSTGGSIGDVLKEVIEIARSRMNLQKKIATMTAEGRFNALLLGSLPIGLTLYLRGAQPKYADVVWSEQMGITMYFLTLFLAVFGAWLAMRIARVTV